MYVMCVYIYIKKCCFFRFYHHSCIFDFSSFLVLPLSLSTNKVLHFYIILAVSFYSSLWSRPLLAFAVTQIQRSIMLANYLIISFTFGFLQIYSNIFSLDNNKVLLYIHIYVYIQYMYVCINIYFLFFEKGSAA